MTYEDKLLIILKALNEARKVPSDTGLIHLYTTRANGLNDFDENEIWDILNKIELEEKVIRIQGYPSGLNSRLSIDFDHVLSNTDSFFTLQLLDNFDDWYKKILIKGNGNKELINYDNKTCILTINNKPVKLQKDSFRANLINLLLKDDKSKKRQWHWEEVLEDIQGISDTDSLKENKKSFYPACDGLAKLVAQKTGINDLLIFNKSTVQINPKYLH